MRGDADKRAPIPALEELRSEFVRVARAESHLTRRQRPRVVTVAAAAVGLIVAGAVAGILVTIGGDRAAVPQADPGARVVEESGGFEASGVRYASLGELVLAAELVATGTVEEVAPGEIEFEGTPDEIRHTRAVVALDEVWRGSAASNVVTVETLELAFTGPEIEEWREPGEQVLLFLTPSRENPGLHILADNPSQTAYVIRDGDVVPAVGDPLSERIAALSLVELRQAVQQVQSP